MEKIKEWYRKICKMDSWLVLDFLEDKVKSRWLFPLAALFILTFLSYSIFTVSTSEKRTPSSVNILMEPAPSQEICEDCKNSRISILRVNDKTNYAIESLKVETEVQSIDFTGDSKGLFKCDTALRKTRYQTLDDIRLFNACKLELVGKSAVGDSFGKIVLNNFSASMGPQGMYTLVYKNENEIISDPVSVFFQTQVVKMTLLNKTPSFAAYGVPLSIQPSIKLLGIDGKPVKKKRVVAVSWPEGRLFQELGNTAKNDEIFYNRFALLEGDISEPSDDDGIARFTKLTIRAANHHYVYLMFTVDATLIAFPQEEIPPEVAQYNYIYYYTPIIMADDVNHTHKIEILRAPSSSVVEGVSLEIQPKLRVTKSNGDPVSGVSCVADIVSKNGELFPRSYQFVGIEHMPKLLLRPIPGNYLSDSWKPASSSIFQAYYTDSNGVIEYDSLGFDVSGDIGALYALYGITFKCGGAFSEIVTINVSSSVTNVQLVQEITWMQQFVVSPYDFAFSMKVTNKDGDAVKGKSLGSIETLASDLSTGLTTNIIRAIYWGRTATDINGINLIHILIKTASEVPETIRMNITYDGVSNISDPIKVYAKQLSSTHEKATSCQYIKWASGTSRNLTVKVGDSLPDLVAYVQNYLGKPVTSGDISPLIDLLSVGLSPYPSTVITFSSESTATPDSDGKITFSGLTFSMGYNGIYLLHLGIRTSAFEYTCKTEWPIRINLVQSLEYIEIVTPEFLQGHYLPVVPTDTSYQIRLRLLDINRNILPSYSASDISISCTGFPPIQYMPSGDLSIYYTLSYSTTVADTTGEIDLSFKMKNIYPGRWALVFSLDGKPSPPITFVTDMPVEKIEIIQEPTIQDYQKMGFSFEEPFQVKVSVSKGDLEGYLVEAFLTGCTDEDIGSIDVFSPYNDDPYSYLSHVTFHSDKYASTNIFGIATFTSLVLIDMNKPRNCFKLRFGIGDPGLVILSNYSQEIPFVNPFRYSIEDSYSKRYVKTFVNPLSLIIEVDTGNYFDRLTPMSFSARITEMNFQKIPENISDSLTKALMLYPRCYWKKVNPVGYSISGCSLEELENGDVWRARLKWVNFEKANNYPATEMVFRLNTLSSSNQSSDYLVTDPIYITTKPVKVEYVMQPPETVKVGEIFAVIVSIILHDDVRLSDVEVSCNITDPSFSKITEYQTSQLMYIMGRTSDSLGNIAMLFSDKHASLNSKYSKGYSINGYSTIYIQFTAGITSNYSLICECLGVKSEPSNEFKLVNDISQITISNFNGAEIKTEFIVEDDVFEEQQIDISGAAPVVYIKDGSGVSIEGKESALKLYALNLEDVNRAYELVLKGSGNIDDVTLYNISVGYNMLAEDSALDQIYKLWKSLTGGVEAISQEQQTDIFAPLEYSGPTYSQGGYHFSNLKLTLQKPGSYQLIAMAEGIESRRSPSIVIENEESSAFEAFMNVFENVIVCFILLFVIIANLIYANKYITIIVFPIIIFEIVLVSMASEKGLFYQLVADGILFALLGFCGRLLYQEAWVKDTTTQEDVRKKVFQEYTYQQVFHRPSEHYKVNKEIEPINEEEKEDPGSGETQKDPSLEGSQERNTKTCKEEIKEKLSNLLILIQPFGTEYNLRKRLVSVFFFPHRMLFAMISGVFTLIFGAIKVITFFTSVLIKIKRLKNDIEKQLTSFLMSGIGVARSSALYEYSEKDLQPFYNLISNFLEQMELLYEAMRIAFIIGSVIAILSFLISFVITLADFKEQVITARSGKLHKELEEIDIKDASEFPGLVISNCIIGLILISFLSTLVLTALFHPLFWLFIYENRYYLLLLAIPIAIALLLSYGVNRLIYEDETRFKRRGWVQVVDVVGLATSLLEGVAMSVGRFFVALAVMIMAMTRLDKPVIPQWVSKYFRADGLNTAYLGMIKAYHVYNNPIATTCTQPRRLNRVSSS